MDSPHHLFVVRLVVFVSLLCSVSAALLVAGEFDSETACRSGVSVSRHEFIELPLQFLQFSPHLFATIAPVARRVVQPRNMRLACIATAAVASVIEDITSDT